MWNLRPRPVRYKIEREGSTYLNFRETLKDFRFFEGQLLYVTFVTFALSRKLFFFFLNCLNLYDSVPTNKKNMYIYSHFGGYIYEIMVAIF